MGLIRLVILGVIFFLAYYIFKKLFFSKSNGKSSDKLNSNPETQTMVKCHLCGMHLPQGQALLSNSRYYCCEDHLQKDNP